MSYACLMNWLGAATHYIVVASFRHLCAVFVLFVTSPRCCLDTLTAYANGSAPISTSCTSVSCLLVFQQTDLDCYLQHPYRSAVSSSRLAAKALPTSTVRFSRYRHYVALIVPLYPQLPASCAARIMRLPEKFSSNVDYTSQGRAQLRWLLRSKL